jgi:hypothetical protein
MLDSKQDMRKSVEDLQGMKPLADKERKRILESIQFGRFDAALLVKLSVIVAIFATLKSRYAVLIALVLTWSYRFVIGFFCGVSPLPIMDINTFYTNDKALTNVMSGTPLSINATHVSRECFTRLVKAHLKMRSRIVRIFGDAYYKEIPIEEVLDMCITTLPDKTINSKEDLEHFYGRHLGEPMPLEAP